MSAQGKRGIVFEEGAVPEIRLVSSDGTVIRPFGDLQATARFRDLTVGDYVLKAAQRPCAGNCRYLDPPTNRCEGNVHVDGQARARVTFVDGERCTIAP